MGKIFNKNKNETVIGEAPDSPETPGEMDYMDKVNKSEEKTKVQSSNNNISTQIQEIPRCMSQTQINNLIIDMDMKLNYIISKMEE